MNNNTNMSVLIDFTNKKLVHKLEEIQKSKFTGIFRFNEGRSFLQASFNQGLLHSDKDGVAWSESDGYEMRKLAWAKNGIVQEIDDDGKKFVLNQKTGRIEPSLI